MKPRSIISLIVAAVLVLAGIITCVVASSMAKSDGVMLFPEEDKNGNLTYRMELDGTSKITVNAVDADISIIGGAETSMIEIVNFNANYYKLTENGGSVNFAQIDDFLSMFKFWDNGFSFKGMRYILRFGDDAAGNKKVVIRLADSDDIRLVNLTTDTGTISVENCSFGADYTLKAENGKSELKNVNACSSLSIYGNSAEVSLSNCETDKLTVNGNSLNTTAASVTAADATVKVTDGSIELKDSSFDTLSASTVSGNITVSPCKAVNGNISTESGNVNVNLDNADTVAAHITTKNGKISVNGEYTESYSINNIAPEQTITVSTESGDVTVTHP